MATYRYACTNEECETREFTLKRPMDESREPGNCPQCNSACERLATDFCKNFALKGGGWYRDGYSGNSHHAEALKAGKDPYK